MKLSDALIIKSFGENVNIKTGYNTNMAHLKANIWEFNKDF